MDALLLKLRYSHHLTLISQHLSQSETACRIGQASIYQRWWRGLVNEGNNKQGNQSTTFYSLHPYRFEPTTTFHLLIRWHIILSRPVRWLHVQRLPQPDATEAPTINSNSIIISRLLTALEIVSVPLSSPKN